MHHAPAIYLFAADGADQHLVYCLDIIAKRSEQPVLRKTCGEL